MNLNDRIQEKVDRMLAELPEGQGLSVGVKELPDEDLPYFDGAVVYKDNGGRILSILVGENSGGSGVMHGTGALTLFLSNQLENNLYLRNRYFESEIEQGWEISYVDWTEYAEEFTKAVFWAMFSSK